MTRSDSNQPIGVAIIGCGDMGAKHARAWQRREEARIIAVSSPTPEHRDALARTTGAKAYADAYEAMTAEGVSAVSICTPGGTHADLAVHALSCGRHVLCEKPLALSLADADRMIGAAHKGGALLATSFQYRGVPRVRHFRRMVTNGVFGGPLLWHYRDIRQVRPKLAMHKPDGNGGVVIDMAGHHIDAMRHVTGCEPLRVSATGHVFGRGKPTLAEIDDPAIDAAMMQIEYEQGHVLQMFLNWGMTEGFPEHRAEYLAGPAIAARVGEDHFEKHFQLLYGETVETFEDDVPNHACRIDDLLDAILGHRSPEVTGRDGRIALAVSLAAIKSLQTRTDVSLAT